MFIMQVTFSVYNLNSRNKFQMPLASANKLSFGNKIISKTVNDSFKASKNFKVKDFFIPLSSIKTELLADLENVKTLMPPKLLKKMGTALEENNFNLRIVYENANLGIEPSKELEKIFKKADAVIKKYSCVPDLKADEMNSIANKYAVKKSKYWQDFKKLTENNIWTPMRFIRHKYSSDGSKYNTSRLTDIYLYFLYKNNYQNYVLNPLSQCDCQNELSKEIANTINYLYMTNFKNPNFKPDSPEFLMYKKQFDIASVGRSIEHMESVYRKQFMKNYRAGKRAKDYDKAFAEGKSLIREKIDFSIANKKQEFKTLRRPEWVQAFLF